jgi:hypothetical protein
MSRRLALVLSVALIGAGCSKEQPPAPDPKADPKADPKKAADPNDPLSKLAKKIEDKVASATGALTKGGPALTLEQYEALMLGLAKCQLNDSGIDYKCPELKTYNEARNRGTALRDLAGRSSDLGLKHMKHASPAVRYTAAGMLGSFFGAKPEVQEAVIKAIPEEKDPLVLAALIRAVASTAKRNPKVGELLIKLADHEAERVRIEVIGWLTTSFCEGLAGGADKVIEKIEKDPSQKVQQSACENAGKTGDPRLMPIFKKLTKKADDNPMYSSCMRGLIDMWNPFLSREAPLSADAYKLTINRLNDKPRGKDRPPWLIMSNLGRAPKGPPAWYKPASVAKALQSIALDEAANWMARTGACRSLGELKATKELEAIGKALADKTTFEDKQIAKAAAEGLAKAGK